MKEFFKTALGYAEAAVAIASLVLFVGVCSGLMFKGCNYILTVK